MEFYNSFQNDIAATEQCFNSQRDGILHLLYPLYQNLKRGVSIPNGMEFYKVLMKVS